MPIGEELAAHKAALARELVKFDQEVVDLEAVLEDQVKVLRRMQDQLRNETIGDSAVAQKGLTLSLDAVKKGRELTVALASAVQSQKILHQTAEYRKKVMTPEQRDAAFERAVRAMPYKERRAFLTRCVEAHNLAVKAGEDVGIKPDFLTQSFLELQ